jgi:hypothetical protein
VRLQYISIDEQITDIFNKPISGTSLERMKMFPSGSFDDCSIMLIFQDLSDRLDHVGIGPDVIFNGTEDSSCC